MRRFPFGLTIAAAVAFALLVGLGVWQLHRLAWKEALLAKIAALQSSSAQPIGAVLARAAAGTDVDYQRVNAACAPRATAPPSVFRYAVRDGRVGWRLLGACRLAGGGPYDGVVLDRGLVGGLAGAMAPTEGVWPQPRALVGVLRAPGGKPLFDTDAVLAGPGPAVARVLDSAALARIASMNGLAHPAPYLLAVESETPSASGLTPAALPTDIPNNHRVYALTWFALAGILAWFYVALLWRRMRG